MTRSTGGYRASRAGAASITAWTSCWYTASSSASRAIAFAIEQPPGVDVNEIVVRPTAQT
jgi:NADP-dependent 3-hydroxy acid dehydrogenase YdfG